MWFTKVDFLSRYFFSSFTPLQVKLKDSFDHLVSLSGEYSLKCLSFMIVLDFVKCGLQFVQPSSKVEVHCKLYKANRVFTCKVAQFVSFFGVHHVYCLFYAKSCVFSTYYLISPFIHLVLLNITYYISPFKNLIQF